MLKPRHIMALGGVSALLFAFAPAALAATSGSVNVFGTVSGSNGLSIAPVAPANPAWAVTLDPTGNKLTSYTQNIGVYDDTGSGTGWSEQVTSTNYVGTVGLAATEPTSGPFEFGGSGDSSNLTADASQLTETIGAPAATPVGDSYWGSTGSFGSGVIPQGGNLSSTAGFTGDASSAPVATTFVSAPAGQGMGDFNTAQTVHVVVPADAYAGTYESIATYSIVSGPGA